MQFEVKVHKIINNDKPLKVICSVTLGEMFAIYNVRVIKTDKGMFIGMPFEVYTDKDGNEQRRDVFHPISSEARKAMEEAVIAAYEAKVNA